MAEDFKPCSVTDCKGNAHRSANGATGLCCAHYKRKQKTGDPLGSLRKDGPAIGWLKAHIGHEGDECLIWPFFSNSTGYGSVRLNQKTFLAHRLMCIFAHGEPAGRMDAAHSCGRGSEGCVNPNHLRWASRSENTFDKVGHGTDNRGVRNPLSKLKDSEIQEIRDLRGSLSQSAIAKIYGVDQSNISVIQTGKSWSWLD